MKQFVLYHDRELFKCQRQLNQNDFEHDCWFGARLLHMILIFKDLED